MAGGIIHDKAGRQAILGKLLRNDSWRCLGSITSVPLPRCVDSVAPALTASAIWTPKRRVWPMLATTPFSTIFSMKRGASGHSGESVPPGGYAHERHPGSAETRRNRAGAPSGPDERRGDHRPEKCTGLPDGTPPLLKIRRAELSAMDTFALAKLRSAAVDVLGRPGNHSGDRSGVTPHANWARMDRAICSRARRRRVVVHAGEAIYLQINPAGRDEDAIDSAAGSGGPRSVIARLERYFDRSSSYEHRCSLTVLTFHLHADLYTSFPQALEH